MPFAIPKRAALMSALGQKRTCRLFHAMSALPPKADIRQRDQDVCFGPLADKVRCSKRPGYSIIICKHTRLQAVSFAR
jgi:hypothetical protein